MAVIELGFDDENEISNQYAADRRADEQRQLISRMNQTIEATASRDDVRRLYNFFLRREPESDQVLSSRVGVAIADLVGDFVRAEEFQRRVCTSLTARPDGPPEYVFGRPGLDMVEWAMSRLGLSEQTASEISRARTWAQIDIALLRDEIIWAALAPNLKEETSPALQERLRLLELGDRSFEIAGCLDIATPDLIAGWCCDCGDLANKLSVEIYAENELLGTVSSSAMRADLINSIGGDGRFGFSFRAHATKRSLFEQDIWIIAREASSGRALGKILYKKEDVSGRSSSANGSGRQEGRTRVADERKKTFFDLYTHLTRARGLATPIMASPLRLREEGRKGFIEAICLEDTDQGLIWFVGWTSEVLSLCEPAVIVDGQKIPAAFSVVTFPRNDLPMGARGMLGVILSEWIPIRGSLPIIYFGASGRSSFQSVNDLPLISKQVIKERLTWARGLQGSEGKWHDMIALLSVESSWVSNPVTQKAVEVAVDRLLIVPSLGCFVAGWTLSNVHLVLGFALKMGSSVSFMDTASLRISARPDLASVFPHFAHLVEQAGFCVFFRGQHDLRFLDAPQLKILLNDGGAAYLQIPIGHVRRLDRPEAFDELFSLYPSIHREDFFEPLAEAIRSEYRKRGAHLELFRVNKAKRLLIIAIPENTHDCRLAFEEIEYHCAKLPQDCGVVIIANHSQRHGQVGELFDSISQGEGSRYGLIFSAAPDAALYAIREILLVARADSFVFIAQDHFLTQIGWTKIYDMLQSTEKRDLTILGVIDPDTQHEMRQSASCFAWNREAFSAWVKRANIPLQTPTELGDFDTQSGSERKVPGAVNCSRRPAASRMTALINRSARQRLPITSGY